jgi:small neutral amino acid transporter SnatA (MarC family)
MLGPRGVRKLRFASVFFDANFCENGAKPGLTLATVCAHLHIYCFAPSAHAIHPTAGQMKAKITGRLLLLLPVAISTNSATTVVFPSKFTFFLNTLYA